MVVCLYLSKLYERFERKLIPKQIKCLQTSSIQKPITRKMVEVCAKIFLQCCHRFLIDNTVPFNYVMCLKGNITPKCQAVSSHRLCVSYLLNH